MDKMPIIFALLCNSSFLSHQISTSQPAVLFSHNKSTPTTASRTEQLKNCENRIVWLYKARKMSPNYCLTPLITCHTDPQRADTVLAYHEPKVVYARKFSARHFSLCAFYMPLVTQKFLISLHIFRHLNKIHAHKVAIHISGYRTSCSNKQEILEMCLDSGVLLDNCLQPPYLIYSSIHCT